MTKGFIINQSLMDSLETATDTEFREIVIKLYDYSINEEKPEFSTDLGRIIFSFYKPIIDRNNEKYNAKLEGGY